MAFQPFDTNHSAHTDVSINLTTGTVYITVAFHPLNKGGYNCRLYELAPPYTGLPVLKRDWKQGSAGIVGPFGHGASLLLPTGGLLTAVPVGIDSASNITPAIQIEQGYGAPYALGGGGGGGGIILFPAPLEHATWSGRILNGGVVVDIPATFGAPPSSAYLVRFVAVASAADIRVRAGAETAPAFLTLNTQVAGLQQHIQGFAPGPQMYISTAGGAAQVWLQICGYQG